MVGKWAGRICKRGIVLLVWGYALLAVDLVLLAGEG